MKTIGLITNKQSKKLFLLPDQVTYLTNKGVKVNIPSNYGAIYKFDDAVYTAAGATVLAGNNEVIAASEVICKVDAFDKNEIKTAAGKICVTMANYFNNVEMLYYMIEQKVTGLAWNNLVDRKGYVFFPEIETLKGQFVIKTIIDGMKKGLSKPKEKVVYPHPAKLLILNATYAGIAAAKVALANGFDVTILDYDKSYLKDLETDSDILALTRKYKTKFTTGSAEFANLEHQIAKYNAFINTSIDPVNKTKLRITKEMANSMPAGSILYDAGTECGYGFAWIKKFPPCELTYTRFNKVFYVAPADTTDFIGLEVSKIISTYSSQYLFDLANEGQANHAIASIVVCNKGKVVDTNVKTQLNLY